MATQPTIQLAKPITPSKWTQIPKYIVNTFALLFLSTVISIIVEWVGMFFEYWDEPNYLHAKNLFLKEVGWVLGDSLSGFHTLANFYASIFQTLDYYFIETTGIKSASVGEFSFGLLWLLVLSIFFNYLARWTSFKDEILISTFLSIIAVLPMLFIIATTIDIVFELQFLKNYLLAMVYVIQITIARILTIFFAIPSVIILLLYVIAEGIYQRHIRQLSGAHESSFIYHHTKRWIRPLIGLPVVLLLSSPFAIHPSVFIVITASMPGVFMLYTIKYFKKYV